MQRMRVALLCVIPLMALTVPAVEAKKAPKPGPQIVAPRQRVCTEKTGTGLGFKVLRRGGGAMPGASDIAIVNYVGYFTKSGEVFDSGQAVPMRANAVVPGFGEGLRMIPAGGIYRLCLPARLAYGASGAGPIPPDSDLVFQVEVLKSMTRAEFEAMRKAARARQPENGE